MALQLKVAALPASKSDFAFLNKAFVSPATCATLGGAGSVGRSLYLQINGEVFLLGYSDAIADGELCVSGPQRMSAKLQMVQYPCEVFPIDQAPVIAQVTLAIDVLKKGAGEARFEIEGAHFQEHVKVFLSEHVLKPGQGVPMKYRGKKLSVGVKALQQAAPGSGVCASSGRLDASLSSVELVLAAGAGAAGLVLKDGKSRRLEFKSNFNFEEMGIGGLDEQFTAMFRKAFATRMYVYIGVCVWCLSLTLSHSHPH